MKKLCSFFVVLLLITSVALFAGGQGEAEQNVEDLINTDVNPDNQVAAPFEGWIEGLPRITAPEGFDWKQFEGVELNFISENTPPSSALDESIEAFESVTGITVTIEQSDLGTVVEKVGLDVNARKANYQIIYADPYQILSKQFNHFVNLNKFIENENLPPIPGGKEDFIQSQLKACGYMETTDNLYALPYDCPTIVLAYRKDVFNKYQDQFMDEMGYDWTPDEELTWQQYYEIAQWIQSKIDDGTITEVQYASGHQAKQHDSLMCDFSNVLAAHGGAYFTKEGVGSVGKTDPGECVINSEEGIQAAQFYKKLIAAAAPGSSSWDWNGLADAYAAGNIALAPEWHEFSSMFENPDSSEIPGKTAWSVMPTGPVRNANIYGGTGVAINKYASPKQQLAAYLFLVWATSPQAQYYILQSELGGSTPTRNSVYELDRVQRGMEPGTEEAKEMPNLLSVPAVLNAWETENVFMRPKIPQWPQVDTIIYTNLSKMLAGDMSPEEAVNTIKQKTDQLTGQ